MGKTLTFSIFFIFFSTSFFAQHTAKDTLSKKDRPSLIKRIWQNKPENSIVFMPFGTHTHRSDILHVYYTGVYYEGFQLSTFRNSYKDWCVNLNLSRKIDMSKRFSFLFGGGFIYGYNGRLQHIKGIPLRNTFLFKSKINPVLGLAMDYKVNKHWSIHGNALPLVLIIGIRYRV